MESQEIAVDAFLTSLRAELGVVADANSLRAAFEHQLRLFNQAEQAEQIALAAGNPQQSAHCAISNPSATPSTNPLASFPNSGKEPAQCILANIAPASLAYVAEFVQYLPVAVSWFDEQMNMRACNSLYRDLLGFPEEMFRSGRTNYQDFISFNAERGEYGPGDPAEITAQIISRAREPQSHVFERVRPDGTVLEVRGMPVPGGGFVTVYADITAHKRAEQATIRNETYLRAVIAQLPQGLTVIDENLDIVLWNRLWESNCGARPGFLYDGVTFEAAVRHLAEMGEYGGGDAAAIDEQVTMRVELAKQFQPHCFRRTRASGRVIEIEGRPMQIDGKIAGFITMYNDITDRLAIDDLKQAKEAAEAANQMKSEFLALISHEIRTPLAGVIGMLKLALRDHYLQDETRKLIARGEDNAQSLLTIINDLLDFSKIEAGKLSLENIDFALQDVMQDVVGMFAAQALAKGLQLNSHLADNLPQYVLGDPVRLRQVLVNLLGNAFKFTERGSVGIKLDMLRREHGISYVRFAVEDSGIGIASDAVDRIFEKFEQADNATTRRFGGTGLGLAISRQLVELMGGEIGVTSVPGQGSVFYFELPLADGVARQQVCDAQLLPHSHQLRILAADDFVTNQIIIRLLVEGMGHLVEVVDSGEAAIEAAARTEFDVILMDGRMPGMDGVTASRLIRAGGTEQAKVLDKDVYIIAVTANASESDRKYYLQAGMDDFLSKPIEEAKLHRQLSQVIERQLQRNIALSPRILASHDELQAMFALPQTCQDDGVVRQLDTQQVEHEAVVPLPSAAASPPVGEKMGVVMHERDIMRQMHSAFVQDVIEKLKMLEQALIERRADDTGRMLHSMRGSLVYLEHTEELQALCHELEPKADAGQWNIVEENMPRLRDLVASSLSDSDDRSEKSRDRG